VLRRLVIAALVLPILIFFLAPVIPVGSPPWACGHLEVAYTDWQSPSYHVLSIGYHYVAYTGSAIPASPHCV